MPDSSPAPEPGFAPSPAPGTQQPAAAFDPTPDTKVPLRGHTSFPHNVQSERVAAMKGNRARLGTHRKH
ncbi:MAG: hypothetical protein ABI599_07940 [Flavobacteriales bacterium]